jgi:adenylate cyclase
MAGEAYTPEQVRAVLTGESPGLAKQRRAFRRIPSPPRCKLCAAPFAGVGGLILRQAGYRQSAGNPALCTICITALRKRQLTGVEIPITLLFSDIRGSTAMGERMRPADFHTFLDRFYRLASDSIVAHDGIVDKVVGDEVIGLFFGGISGPPPRGSSGSGRNRLGRGSGTGQYRAVDVDTSRNGRPHRRGICWGDRAWDDGG